MRTRFSSQKAKQDTFKSILTPERFGELVAEMLTPAAPLAATFASFITQLFESDELKELALELVLTQENPLLFSSPALASLIRKLN